MIVIKSRVPIVTVIGVVLLLLVLTSFPSSEKPSISSREEALSNMEGAGENTIYIHHADAQTSLFDFSSQRTTATGVLVIAEGADQPSIKLKLRQTVASVLQIAEHRVIVEPMKGVENEP